MLWTKGFMRKWILSLALALTSVLSFSQVTPEVKEEQHRATVTIVMKGKTEGAGCSATAIAEHVLLTAEHCDIPDGVVYLNQTEAPFIHPLEVSYRIFDKQDHMLLVLPQVSFKHTIPYDPNTYVPLKKGDHYYLWGNPGLIPDQYREGYVTDSFTPPKDSLEVDVHSPFTLIRSSRWWGFWECDLYLGWSSRRRAYLGNFRRFVCGNLSFGVHN